MSNISLIVEERAAHIGNFLVGRLLPFRQKRTVGPFCFIDHMGPAHMSAEENLDVAPHPHIGLSTLTYLFEGTITHRDSLGTLMDIQPGAVNWMTAGKGVVHSERTPLHLRDIEKSLHGLQIWVALPKDLEEMEPSFQHVEAKDIPHWQENGVEYRLIAGELHGHHSPVNAYSPLYMLEIKSKGNAVIDLRHLLFGESGLYILSGSVNSGGHQYGERNILITQDAHLCTFEITAGSTIYIFGGEPFPEDRFIYWNFVSSSRERIEQAKEDWRQQKFPKVPGETVWTPLPEPKLK